MTYSPEIRLTEACKTGNIAEAERLIAAGANIDAPGLDYGPLVWAANNGHAACVSFLLEKGADPDIRQTLERWTPLMCAASKGHAETVEILVKAGANPSLRNKDGNNALALARMENHHEIVNILDNNPDEISFFHNVDDRVMQEVFNFPRKERVTLIRKIRGGDVEAMQRDSFRSLDDQPGLRRAFEEHAKRGGKMTEEEVFENALPKKDRMLPKPR